MVSTYGWGCGARLATGTANNCACSMNLWEFGLHHAALRHQHQRRAGHRPSWMQRIWRAFFRVRTTRWHPTSTTEVARDMDLVRHLVGRSEAQLRGLFLRHLAGAWYARCVLSVSGAWCSIAAWTLPTTLTRPSSAQVQARQRLHDAVLLPFAARHPQFFGLGAAMRRRSARRCRHCNRKCKTCCMANWKKCSPAGKAQRFTCSP